MNNPVVSNYQTSKWAAEPLFLESFIRQISGLNITESLADIEVAAKPRSYSVIGGRAVINISGVLLKTVPGWLRFWGIEATGYDEINAQIGQAIADESITGIHLRIDSPGGIIDGLAETADAIYAARSSKKVTATVEDLSASAAYWLAAQAETIAAGRTAEVGSIGVYTVYLDASKAAEEAGFRVVLIRSGEHKGMGVLGAEITDEQIAAVQDVIDKLAAQFVKSVARGRAAEEKTIAALATGRLWIAGDAKKLGLIDRVTNIKQQDKSNSKSKGETKMDNENKTDTAEIEKAVTESAAAAKSAETERMKAMNEAFADDPRYAIEAFAEGKTVEQAKADYCDILRERLAKKDNEKRAENSEAAVGSEPLATGDTDGDNGGDFLTEARAMAAEKKISVTAAMKKLQRQNPAAHEAFKRKCETDGESMYAEVG